MLISMNQRDARLFDVYRINVDTGEMKQVAENPGNIDRWVTDNNGNLRVATTSDGVNTSLLYRKSEADTFRTIVTTSFKETISPLYFTFDDAALYVLSNLDRDKAAVYRYDVENGKFLDLIYENPEVDVDRLLRSKLRKVITGVTYVTDKTHYHFLDDERRALQESLEARLPGREVAVAGLSKDETKALIVTYDDKSQGTYYFYDLKTKDLRKLVDISPWLPENQMADMKPVEYTSRDGLTIHGYLTLPNGLEPKNLPVVVNPHGGPWARDRWGFNPEVQFLANRGYAVLQMNFRGSTGYGKAFWQASFKEWGKAMQNDITDGAQWLIAQGIADPKRIAIYGGSYGGYATLAGLAFTPDLYACGVDYVGVSNMFTFLNSFPPYWELGRKMIYEMVGDPEKDKELLDVRFSLLPRRSDQGSPSGRAGSERSACQQGRIGSDRERSEGARNRCSVSGEGQRGTRVHERGEPIRLLPHDGAIPRQTPWRKSRGSREVVSRKEMEMANRKIGVVLCGCGVQDGSEIHEAVCTLLEIARNGAEAVCVAPDLPQADVVDHLKGAKTSETRNMLTEAARIARGKVRDIHGVGAKDLDAVILPGGFGAAKNLCDFAVSGANCRVNPDVERLLLEMHAAGKPIGAICIAPTAVARVFGKKGIPVQLTIGSDPGTAAKIETMGARHVVRNVREVCIDEENRIVSTPAYMLAGSIDEAADGIALLVREVVKRVR